MIGLERYVRVKFQKVLNDILKVWSWDFPGCPGIENLLSNAGAVGSISGLGTNIPHASGTQLKKGEGGARGDQTKGLWGR